MYRGWTNYFIFCLTRCMYRGWTNYIIFCLTRCMYRGRTNYIIFCLTRCMYGAQTMIGHWRVPTAILRACIPPMALKSGTKTSLGNRFPFTRHLVTKTM